MAATMEPSNKKPKPVNLNWEQSLPQLPYIEQQPHIGLAGAFSGVFNNNRAQTIMVAGGTNFPNLSLLDAIKLGITPEKVYHKDVLLYRMNKNTNIKNGQWLKTVTTLPNKMAHGASVNFCDGILLFGGESQDDAGNVNASNAVYKLSLLGDEIQLKRMANMPFTFCYGSASKHKNSVYICGGMQNGQASNQVWCYDIDTDTWSLLQDYPGPPRTELISTVGKDEFGQYYLYLFSGCLIEGDMVRADTTGIKLKLTEDIYDSHWQFTQSIIPAHQSHAISLLGATSVQITSNYTICLGGYNHVVFNNFVQQLKQSQSEAQTQQIKVEFFSQPSELFNWNKHALLFNSANDTWFSLGESPFLPNCGACAESIDAGIVLISGEIKPGVRTPSVKLAKLTNAGFNIG